MRIPIGKLGFIVSIICFTCTSTMSNAFADVGNADRIQELQELRQTNKLIARLNSIGSEETFQTNFTSKQRKEATDRAFGISANF
jgi:hypothetical protein